MDGVKRSRTISVRTPQSSATFAGLIPLFSLTAFVGSGLLFLVEPVFAKLLLPRLGGSPSVWNTCVLFFQTALLLGYVYTHLATRWLGVRRQVALHLLVLLLPALVLPIALGDAQPPATANPVWWLLRTMGVTLGLPFFVVATSAPLLQRWFSSLPMAAARDPYFLYSASNLGSMVSLFAYPLAVEPAIGTREQTWLWTIGYALFAALTACCGFLVLSGSAGRREAAAELTVASPRTTWRLRATWLVLSFVPSSLMLGVTTHISTDIAAVPLLWILPLGMYLGTFVLAFAQRQYLSDRWLSRAVPPLVFACLLTVAFNKHASRFIPVHLTTFFVVALMCHRGLAARRPSVDRLTEFYIWMSIGGTCGGIVNTLVAPQLFSGILEYPLALACAALLRPSPDYRGGRPESLSLIVGLPAFILLLCAGVWALGLMSPGVGFRPVLLASGMVFAGASVLANRVPVFAVAALAFVGMVDFGRPSEAGVVLRASRSFFGVHRVVAPRDGRFHLLQHGSTTHGRQEWPAASACDPTGYYHPASPIGELFRTAHRPLHRVAVVGLGTGALACYAAPGDLWTFYEIDPVVESIARDPSKFTYLKNSPGLVDVVLGDGRVMLQRTAPGTFDVVTLDAFSSDAIPVHLLTREAIALYLSKLKPEGVLAVHISNRYVNLEPVLASVAALDGLAAVAKRDADIPARDQESGRFPSHWVLIARHSDDLQAVSRLPGWRQPLVRPGFRPWTDDYSNILKVLTR